MASTADAEAWETDERGYVFEERLATAAEHKDRGNEHFKAGEWQIALRRYERALYHCAFDPMQMYDLMEKHKAAAYAVQTPVKLNYVACVLQMREAGLDVAPVQVEGEEEPRDPLDRCEELIGEVLKAEPNHAKAHFRRAQLLRARGDTRAAQEALEEAERAGGGSASVRAEQSRLREMARAERSRERELYSGIIQPSSNVKAADEAAERRARRGQLVETLALPVTGPLRALWWAAAALVSLLRRLLAVLLRLRPGGALEAVE